MYIGAGLSVNSNRGGGYGFPDAVDIDNYVWEVKPFSIYGFITGPLQIARYTNNTGFYRGYHVGVTSFRSSLFGVQGWVGVMEGFIEGYDTGVVYYLFFPDRDVVAQPIQIKEKEPEPKRQPSVLEGILLGVALLITVVDPIPGDEALVLGAVAFLFP